MTLFIYVLEQSKNPKDGSSTEDTGCSRCSLNARARTWTPASIPRVGAYKFSRISSSSDIIHSVVNALSQTCTSTFPSFLSSPQWTVWVPLDERILHLSIQEYITNRRFSTGGFNKYIKLALIIIWHLNLFKKLMKYLLCIALFHLKIVTYPKT